MKLCEIYDEGCSSLSFDYTCKIRDGTEFLFFIFFYYAIIEQQIQRNNKQTMRVTNNNPKHTKLAYKIYTMKESYMQ